MQLEASILGAKSSTPLLTLVDSGADDSFIDSSRVTEAGLPVEQLSQPKDVNTLDGRLLAAPLSRL